MRVDPRRHALRRRRRAPAPRTRASLTSFRACIPRPAPRALTRRRRHGARAAGASLDCYSVDEQRWLGDPLAYEDEAPKPQSLNHGAACVAPKADTEVLYYYGGKNKDGVVADELWCFDVKRLAWELLPPAGEAPCAREQCTLTRVLTRYLVLFGGLNAEGLVRALQSRSPRPRRLHARCFPSSPGHAVRPSPFARCSPGGPRPRTPVPAARD